jgi:aminopeptidase N
LKFGSLRADAGIGTAITIKKFGPMEMVNPFTIRFDMPLVLNRPPFEEKDYFKFRYVVGVSRSF